MSRWEEALGWASTQVAGPVPRGLGCWEQGMASRGRTRPLLQLQPEDE